MPIPSVQIPPDSTGKRIAQVQFSEVSFNTGTILFPIGDIVTGVTSGAFGTIVFVEGSVSTGSVYIKMGHDSPTNFITGENLQVSAVTHAVSQTSTPYYSALVQLSGGNNPLQSAYVDQRGSLYTRGPDGWHKFDVLGRMQTTGMEWIGAYDFSTSKEDELWGESIVSGGSAFFSANNQSVVLRCNTSSGAKIQRTTHLYHHMIPGIAPNIFLAVSLGDNGKTNCTRRWGYYDDRDGIFFEHDGTTMNVGMRTSSSGTPVDYLVARADWNSDRLDGSHGLFNLSNHQADLTNTHMFWMDFQSSGYCRWGTQSEEGEKIVVHKRATSNAIFAMMATRTLPLRVEQFNTGTTASTSEMSYRSCMVGVEGEWIHPYKAKSVPVTPGVVVANSTIPVFLRAYRAAQTYDGVNNRGFAYGSSVSIYSTAQPIQLLYIKNPTLNNVSGWTAITSNSILERPTTANTITATANTGTILWSSIIPAGQERTFDLAKAIHNVQSDGEIRRLADITASPDTFVWVATSLSGTSTTVTVVPSWHEYR